MWIRPIVEGNYLPALHVKDITRCDDKTLKLVKDDNSVFFVKSEGFLLPKEIFSGCTVTMSKWVLWHFTRNIPFEPNYSGPAKGFIELERKRQQLQEETGMPSISFGDAVASGFTRIYGGGFSTDAVNTILKMDEAAKMAKDKFDPFLQRTAKVEAGFGEPTFQTVAKKWTPESGLSVVAQADEPISAGDFVTLSQRKKDLYVRTSSRSSPHPSRNHHYNSQCSDWGKRPILEGHNPTAGSYIAVDVDGKIFRGMEWRDKQTIIGEVSKERGSYTICYISAFTKV